MLAADIPAKSPKLFAEDATGTYIRTIPQTTVDPAAASFEFGFPPQTFTDQGAGGTPPDGRDFNGILNWASAWSRWLSAGGAILYDSVFQAAVGGYPLGAVVYSPVTSGKMYRSTADSNVTDPDAGGAGWQVVSPSAGSNANGYWTKRPDGNGALVIEQWGRVTGTLGEGPQVVTFPTPFTDAATVDMQAIVLNSTGGSSTAYDIWAQLASVGLTTATVRLQASLTGPTCDGFRWRAIGY